MKQTSEVQLARKQDDPFKLGLRGRFHVQHVRNGEVIAEYDFPNGIVNEGKNRLLGVMFNSATQLTAWYLGLIDAVNGFISLAAGDTYDDINQAGNGWDEFTSYTDPGNGSDATTRPQWTPGSPSAQSITNPSTVNFDITGAGTVHGIFVCAGAGSQAKGDHSPTGVLWATAPFSGGNVAVTNGDQLKVTYTVSA